MKKTNIRGKAYSYGEVKNYIEVESNSRCKLLSNTYTNNLTRLDIQCSCGNLFTTNLANFKDSILKSCNNCVSKHRHEAQLTSIDKIEEIAKFNGYFLISEKYEHGHDNLIIEDKNGYRYLTMSYNMHKNKSIVDVRNPYTIKNIKVWCTINDKPFKLISSKFVKARINLKWKCLKADCSEEFESTWDNISHGKGCPYCADPSKGEVTIKLILLKHNQTFIPEYSFRDCKAKQALRFDFAIFDSNGDLFCLIEYDGVQHFKPVCFGGISKERAVSNFNDANQKDQIKNEYCKTKNIKLIRIPYWEFKNIEEILSRELIFTNSIPIN